MLNLFQLPEKHRFNSVEQRTIAHHIHSALVAVRLQTRQVVSMRPET